MTVTPDHDHAAQVESFGECLVCAAQEAAPAAPAPPEPQGTTYQPELDKERLGHQARRVLALMIDGAWRTLAEISAVTGDPEASVSARLRDLRKVGYQVADDRTGSGGWRYRVTLPPT